MAEGNTETKELSLVESVQEMLKEETWTRTAISAYNTANLTALNGVVQKVLDGGLEEEVKAVCDECLKHTRECVPALYISGMLTLGSDSVDISKLSDLMNIFQKNHKIDEVKMLCREILKKDNKNKFALRTLAGCYDEKSAEVWPLYEQIVKLDTAEANAAKALGEHYASANKALAIDYYKTALVRYTKARDTSGVKEVWRKLVQMVPEEVDYFLRSKRDIAKYINSRTGASLLQDLYKHYKGVENWDVCIGLLKQILEVDPTDTDKRKEIVECYRKKYEGADRLEDYIRASNLTQNYRNVFEAISDFEKHMAFNTGTYVWHKTWGVGKIISINGDMLHINFGRKKGSKEKETHDLTLKTAVSILTPLDEKHFWVKKATTKHEDLRKEVKENKEEILKTIINSFALKCDMKRIKAELVPSVLTSGEWTAWHSAAKKILEESPQFGVDPNDATMYTVLSGETKVSNKIADEFKAQRQLIDRVDVMIKYVGSKETDKGSDDYAEMKQYFLDFMGFLKQKAKTEEQVYKEPSATQLQDAVVAWLAMDETYLLSTAPDEEGEREFVEQFPFKELYSRINNPREMYLTLKDTKLVPLRGRFIKAIKKWVSDWDKQYIILFPVALDGEIIGALEAADKSDMLTRLTRDCVDGWKDNRNAVIYLFREYSEKNWFKAAGINVDKWLIALINIIDLTFREIENHVNTNENKKTNKAATNLLFKTTGGKKDGLLLQYILSNDEEAAKRMFTLINDIKDMEPSYKALMRSRILEKFNDFVFPVTEEKVKQQQNVMYVTAKKLEEKKAEAENIQSVEIPNNAAEISEARKQGDLKENAEYKAAKEAQHFLNERLSQLNNEIAKAVVFDPATITTAIVSFSTEVTLHNTKSGEDEVKKIYGPWESDPDKGIISYLSPLGQALMDKKVGEAASSTKDHDFSFYTVKAIKAAAL